MSATGFESVTVPIEIGMLYPVELFISCSIFFLLFHAFISRSLLYAELLSLKASEYTIIQSLAREVKPL